VLDSNAFCSDFMVLLENSVILHKAASGFLADRTNGRAIGTVLRLLSSVVCTKCIAVKRCVLEQKLLL